MLFVVDFVPSFRIFTLVSSFVSPNPQPTFFSVAADLATPPSGEPQKNPKLGASTPAVLLLEEY